MLYIFLQIQLKRLTVQNPMDYEAPTIM